MGPNIIKEVTTEAATLALFSAWLKVVPVPLAVPFTVILIVDVCANIAFATNTIMKEVSNAFTFFISATIIIIVSVERFKISGAKVAKIRAQKTPSSPKVDF
jgi:hypothetical protein